MALNKYKIGDLITVSDIRNKSGLDLPFYGINKEKTFMPTVADTNGLDGSKYKVMTKNRFVFSGMQTGRDMCIRIGMYEFDFDSLISPAYTTFEVTSKEILPEYFFMLFLSKEMDRYCAFLTDSSVRANLEWEMFCNMEIELPSIEIQQKYVDIYKAMVENQKVYESRLDDLKLVCDGYIEDLRKKMPCEKIGKYIEEINEKNSDGKINNPLGISVEGFIPPKQDTGDLTKYNVFKYNNFVYSPPRINIGSIGLYKGTNEALCSPIYVVFKSSDENKLFPEYLMMWLKRKEFLRSTDFYSIGSVRNNFAFEQMCEVSIPIPDITVQKSIAEIFKVLETRKEINEKLKNQIKDICPVLIQGALKEGRK